MAKVTLEELRKLRENKKTEIQKRVLEGKEVEIIVGMGTCGIAAGAKDALDAFLSQIDANALTDVVVKQTGCMGFCNYEPTVEVRVPGMPATVYNKVNADIAKRIVSEHIIEKKLVSEYVFDRPSIDIINQK